MRYLLLIVACLLGFSRSFARTYKVHTPTEFTAAAAAVAAGDEIVIGNGNYTGWAVAIQANGTLAQPIVIRAENAGKVVFTGDVHQTLLKLSGSYIIVKDLNFEGCQLIKEKAGVLLVEISSAKFCRMSGCVFNRNSVSAQFMPLVAVTNSSDHTRIDNCRFTNNVNNQDVQVRVGAEDVSVYTMIDHNTFMNKDSVTWKGNNGGECVQIGQDPILLGHKYSYATVRDNHFIGCNGEPEVISNKASGNKYISNTFENCHGELVMRGGHDCLIDSNTFAGGTGGIRINGTGHLVTNNRFTALPIAIRLMYGMAKGKIETGFYIAASGCTISNNQISNCETGILVGGSKNADWTGKFDTKRYPSRTLQDVPPFDNKLEKNNITNTKTPVKQDM